MRPNEVTHHAAHHSTAAQRRAHHQHQPHLEFLAIPSTLRRLKHGGTLLLRSVAFPVPCWLNSIFIRYQLKPGLSGSLASIKAITPLFSVTKFTALTTNPFDEDVQHSPRLLWWWASHSTPRQIFSANTSEPSRCCCCSLLIIIGSTAFCPTADPEFNQNFNEFCGERSRGCWVSVFKLTTKLSPGQALGGAP